MPNVSDEKTGAPAPQAEAPDNKRAFQPGQKVKVMLRRDNEVLHGEDPFPAGSVMAEVTLDKTINLNWLAHAISHQLVVKQ